MDTYLAIAHAILKSAKAPLGPREILKRAYKQDIVPPGLYGKTQHKTLQARLSEDILLKRERSSFFRTSPGRFFLREYLTDPTVPAKHRIPIVARRRQRDLPTKRALALLSSDRDGSGSPTIWTAEEGLGLLSNPLLTEYISTSDARSAGEALVWSYTVVSRGTQVLTYRHGRYREGRDGFLGCRSVGFYKPVSEQDSDLFEMDTLGIVNSGLRCVCVDLDFDAESVWREISSKTKLKEFLLLENVGMIRDLLAVVEFECPAWLQPLSRRLSLNDLRWHDLRAPVNHIEDFDPWSQAVLTRLGRGEGHRV